MLWMHRPLVEWKRDKLERKAAIKEREQATGKKVDTQSETVFAGALKSNQDQRKS